MVVSFTPWPLYPRYQLSWTVCGFQFLFASFWQYKILLPLFDIELRSLPVPACSPVTVLRLPQLNSSNGRTAWIFQTQLIAQGSSGWRQQQLLTCCFVQGFEFGAWNTSEKIGYKKFDFLFFFCVYTWTERKHFLFYMHGESAFPAVQFTVPVILGFTVHKTLDVRVTNWRIC